MSSIKFIIFATCVAVVSTSRLTFDNLKDSFKTRLFELHESCKKETGATEDDIKTLQNGTFTEDTKIQCYINCNYIGLKLWTKNGEINPEPFSNVIPAEKSQEVLNAYQDCNKSLGSINDACEKSYKMIKCIYDTALDSFFVG